MIQQWNMEIETIITIESFNLWPEIEWYMNKFNYQKNISM